MMDILLNASGPKSTCQVHYAKNVKVPLRHGFNKCPFGLETSCHGRDTYVDRYGNKEKGGAA